MKANQFNLCPSCIHLEMCVLTSQKSKVWSCSEYDEDIATISKKTNLKTSIKQEQKPEMVMS